MATKKPKSKSILDELLANGSVSKLLVIAVAGIVAAHPDKPFKTSDLLVGYGRFIRALAGQRSSFTAELRSMERLGPREYLKRAGRKIQQAGE